MSARAVTWRHWLAAASMVLMAAYASGVKAELLAPKKGLSLVEDLSRMAPYIGTPVVESSADVLLQLPDQVDGVAPVPVSVRVLQSGVEWITLLTASDHSRVLARFSLESSAIPEVSTRFRSGKVRGVLAVVTLPERILTTERSFSVVPPARSDQTNALVQVAPSNDTLNLDAKTDGKKTIVHFRSVNASLKPVPAPVSGSPYIQRFELWHGGKRVVSAELSAKIWCKPFFQFAFKGGKKGDVVKVHWQGSDGSEGELATRIEEQ